jgi:hypothetical protein
VSSASELDDDYGLTDDDPCSDREALFVVEFLVDLNASAAARRAGYSAANAGLMGWKLTQRPRVRRAIDAALAERANRIKVAADDVVLRLWAIATADPRELAEFRRASCRYCHGTDHKYQYTPREAVAAEFEYQIRNAKNRAAVFDPQGGVGFDPRKPPHPDCPECFGQGVPTQFVHDASTYSAEALALYAGVKATKHGFEVQMHDQRAALVDVGRHLGIFTDNLNLRTPVGGIKVSVTHEVVDPGADDA